MASGGKVSFIWVGLVGLEPASWESVSSGLSTRPAMHHYELNWQGQKVSNRPIMNGDKGLVSQQKLCLPKRFKAPFSHFSWESRKYAYYVHVGNHLTNPLYKIEYKSFSSSLLTTHKLHTPPLLLRMQELLDDG